MLFLRNLLSSTPNISASDFKQSEWTDFFPAEEFLSYSKNLVTTRLQEGSSYVNDCKFENLVSRAILVNSVGDPILKNVLIEKCAFYRCKTSIPRGEGGAILLEGPMECIISKVCAKECTADEAQFSSISLKNELDSIKRNFMLDASVVYCKNIKKGSFGCVKYRYGETKIDKTNISNNEVQSYRSAAALTPSSTGTISYSTISSNVAHEDQCFGLTQSERKYYISKCNIIRNTARTDIININGETTISDSCITANILTSSQGKLYKGKQNEIILVNSYVDSANLCSISKSINKPFINPLLHYEIDNCESTYDEVGELVPEFNTPVLSKKRKIYSHSLIVGAFMAIIVSEGVPSGNNFRFRNRPSTFVYI